MSAQRLGSFLTNVTGTSGQLLRVKTDESGLEMYTPATLPAYTITNDSTDRVINANDTNLDELADVLTTLIKDITTVIGGPVAFQWSTSEQVWPFEKDSSGNVLYCKEVDFGALPNTGTKWVNHSISNLISSKVYSLTAMMNYPNAPAFAWPLPAAHPTASQAVVLATSATQTVIQTGTDWSSYTAKVKIIYAK